MHSIACGGTSCNQERKNLMQKSSNSFGNRNLFISFWKGYGVKATISLVVIIACLLSFTVLASSAYASGKPGVSIKRSTSPTLILKASTWECPTLTFAGKVNVSTMYGQGYINCSENMETIDMTESALWCQPVLWGCLWFNQGQMGPGCTYHGISANFCPSSGVYTRGNISRGQLWAVQTSVCAYAYDGSSDCGSTQTDVQF